MYCPDGSRSRKRAFHDQPNIEHVQKHCNQDGAQAPPITRALRAFIALQSESRKGEATFALATQDAAVRPLAGVAANAELLRLAGGDGKDAVGQQVVACHGLRTPRHITVGAICTLRATVALAHANVHSVLPRLTVLADCGERRPVAAHGALLAGVGSSVFVHLRDQLLARTARVDFDLLFLPRRHRPQRQPTIKTNTDNP
mmetsp:Transcript_46555/g.83978  ORF Transcript_46555/g.83978 Transcript_46555/m.83978 type:complete len:201 (-) Transcript_46555:613-1215(-)